MAGKLSSKPGVNVNSGNCPLQPGKETRWFVTSTSVYCVTGCFPKFSTMGRGEFRDWRGRNMALILEIAHSQFDCIFITLVINEVGDSR